MSSARSLLLYCRAGFEKDCAQEIATIAAGDGVYGHTIAVEQQAWVQFVPNTPNHLAKLKLRLDELIFARQLLYASEHLKGLPKGDRVTPLLAHARELSPRGYSEIWCETADTNEAKELSSLARAITGPLARALRAEKLLPTEGEVDPRLPRLHILFTATDAAIVACARPGQCSDWPMGIVRLKMPRGAPSRSTLKLHEAFMTLLTEKEHRSALQPGMKAVDLGAAPGGWTWQLVQRHMQVTAIDNGRMDAELMESGQVKHRREDGYHYAPPKTVDWVVCDMVAAPARIATLMADWIGNNHARHALFNLKLPMKKRLEELQRCQDIIADKLDGHDHVLRMKHLYHDREEVTAYLRLDQSPPSRRR